MAFPTGWGKKHKLTIDHTKVSGSANLTNFPVYLSGDNFLPDVFTKAAARREINANWLLNDANLQGYWRLESDGSDETANNYDLTAVNSPTHATGKFGNGVDLERDNTTYYKVASATNLNITSSKTVSCWIKPESTGLWQTILTHSDGTTTGYDFFLTASNTIRFGDWGLTTNDSISSDITLAVGTWYHVVGIWDATNNVISVWVNGVKKSLATTGSSASDTGELRIGADRTSSNAFDGIIDDVAVFNRALSDYEVKALYYGTADLRFSSDISGSTELASEVVFFDPDNSLAEVHVKVPTVSYNTDTDFYVWYEASSEAPYAPTATYGSQAVWSDLKYVSSMQGSSEDSTGARTTTDTSISYGTSYGKSGQGALLTRASSSKIAMSNLGISGTTAITISGWIYTTDNDHQRFYNQGVWDSNTAFSFYKHYSIPGLGVTCGNSRDVGCTVTVNNNTWYHVACVYPGSGSMMNIKFYLNGVEQTTASWGAGSGNNPNMADSNYHFGHLFDGRIDSVRVGNIARSSDWIATEYANQNSPSTFVSATEATSNAIFFGTNF